MDFQGRYQILEMLRDGEARTFKARQTSSGRVVLVHQLWAERTPPNQPDLASLVFGFLRRATAEEMKSLVDMGEEESRVFVVTEDLPGCLDLRQWLQSAPGPLPTVGKAGVPKSAPSSDLASTAATRGLAPPARQEDWAAPDGTQLFTTPKALADQTLSASAKKPASTPTIPPERQVQPGTFASPDKLAGPLGGFSEAEVLPAAAPPVAPPPPSSEIGEPGEFTRMFLGSQGASKVHPPAPSSADFGKTELPPLTAPEPPKGKDELGEFGGQSFVPAEKPTQQQPPAGFEVVFERRKQQPRGPAPPAVQKPLPPPPPAPSGEKEAPGEFTRVFYGRAESKAIPTSPEPPAERTLLTSLAPEQPTQSEGPVEPEGPGEFTRLFQAGSPPARPAGPPIPTSLPRPPASMSSSSSQQSPGEFTQLMQGYQSRKSGPTPPVLEQPEPAAPPPPPAADKAKPGEFTRLFQRAFEPTPPPPPVAPPPAVQTPPAAPPSPEPDEFMRMFELPREGAGAPAQGARQAPPPAASKPAAGRAVPAIPVAPVSPPMVPSMPYVQPPVVPSPMVPQPPPYQVPPPQFQPPVVSSPVAMPPQPAMPQMQPMTVPMPMGPQVEPPKISKSKFLVPLIILGGLFVIAVVVVLIFALKH